LPDVEFIEMPESFRVNLYRMSISQANQRDIGDSSVKFGESSVKYGENSAKSDVDSVMFIDGIINETQLNIVKMIEKDNRISAAKIAEELKMSVRAIEKDIKELRTMGILIRHGAARGGYWEIRICR
jgi:predicted HTH transcriptional regulator